MGKISFLFILIISFSFNLVYANDGPNTWTLSLNTSGAIWAVDVCRSNQSVVYAASNTSGAWKSTDAGYNWVQINNGLLNLTLQTIAVSPSNPDIVVAGSTNGGSNPGVYRSTNGGSNWTLINNGITDTVNVQQVIIHPTNPDIMLAAIFTGTGNSTVGLYKTTNGGANWVSSNTGIGAIKNILSLCYNPLNPNVVYCGTSFLVGASTGPSMIYRSNDGGNTWFEASTGLPNTSTEINPVRVISVGSPDTSKVFAGLFMNTSNGGAYFSTNGGNSWTKIHGDLPSATGTLIRGGLIRPGNSSEIYVGLDGGTNKAVWRTTNAGLSWTQFIGGQMTAATTIRGIAFKTSGDSTVFAAAALTPTGVFQYSFIPVGINNNGNEIPIAYRLYQNYPNPFNPVTVINFDLPFSSFVSLEVYDITGSRLKTIINEYMQLGRYSITLDASAFSSGLYIYQLKAGSFTDSKKMILVK